MNKELREKLLTTVITASFFSLTLFLLGPSYLYFTNIVEFSFLYSEILIYFIIISFLSIIIITTILLCVRWAIYQKIILSLFVLSFLLWFQGNILVWDYGLFDGKEINWNSKIIYGLIDSGIWLLIIVIAFTKSSVIYKIIRSASISFVLIQLVSLSILSIRVPETPIFKRYYIDESSLFNFSKERNIIIIVLDAFQTDVFQNIIDEDNSYRAIFDGFTYFRNSVGGFPTTYAAIPLILTGQYYDNSKPIQKFLKEAYLSNSSIPKVLTNNGFQVDLLTNTMQTIFCDNKIISNMKRKEIGINLNLKGKDILSFYDITLFKHLPHFVKRYIYNNQSWFLTQFIKQVEDIQFIERMRSQSKTDINKYTFKFFHLRGVHPPFRINEKLEYEVLPSNGEGYEKQAKGELNITQIFLDTLKRLGIYNNTMIFIVGDHGFGTTAANSILKDTKFSNSKPYYNGKALPLILVKPFGTKGNLRISDAPVSLSDIPKTIFSELSLDYDLTGYSMFKVKESESRKRRFLMYSWGHDFWHKEYLPIMTEYIVSGFSWVDASWHPTYRQFAPGEIRYIIYAYGSRILLGREGNYEQYQLKFQGWSGPENGFTWTEGKSATLQIPINKPKSDLVLEVSLFPFISSGKLKKQRVNVYVQDRKVGDWVITQDGEYQMVIPKDYLTDAPLEITFELPDAVSPFKLGLSNDDRILGIAVKSITLSEG